MRERIASGSDRAAFALGVVFGLVAGVSLALGAFATAAALTDPEHADLSRSPGVPVQQPLATPDTRPYTASVAGVRAGPSHDSAMVGMLPRHQALDVLGRDTTSTWLAINFPPDSTNIGWVAANQIAGLPSVAR